jgi:hypothetical protein
VEQTDVSRGSLVVSGPTARTLCLAGRLGRVEEPGMSLKAIAVSESIGVEEVDTSSVSESMSKSISESILKSTALAMPSAEGAV